MIDIRVPATSANLGPGFDSLGVALGLYNRFRLEPASATNVQGCPDEYANSDNLFLVAMCRGLQELGTPAPEVRLEISADIPVARGLGSSAAMIVGGLCAALALASGNEAAAMDDADRDFVLRLALELEGHPDNIAPALLGGFCCSARGDEATDARGVLVSRSPVPEHWVFHALIPPFELSTRQARAALPAAVPLKDASYNLGRAALVALAFAKGDAGLLASSCGDRLHQLYRKVLIPGYDEVRAASLECGARAVWLSGAGPTLIALKDGKAGQEDFAAAIASSLSRPEGQWKHLALAPDDRGARFAG